MKESQAQYDEILSRDAYCAETPSLSLDTSIQEKKGAGGHVYMSNPLYSNDLQNYLT